LQPVGMWLECHVNNAIPIIICCGFPHFTLGGNHGTTSVLTCTSLLRSKASTPLFIIQPTWPKPRMAWKLSFAHNRMFEDKACTRYYEHGDAQFAEGMKATTVKENHRVEQRGPTGINQPRKTETPRPAWKEDQCPFKINIHLNLIDNLFYLSKKGPVATHCGHVRHIVIFARADQIDKNVAISNIITKTQKTWLSDRGINTKAASAQVLVDYLTVSPDTGCVFLLHDPDSPLTGGAKKGRPTKSSPMRVVTYMSISRLLKLEWIHRCQQSSTQ
jgi:hypothetical protein